MKSKISTWLEDRNRVITWIGFTIYALISLAYTFLGEANSDEGWYLYASRLVFHGALPYQDFAYTQMPLLPYVYGVLQILRPSLMLGRFTSLALSLGTFAMCIASAKRCSGKWAAGVTALFLAAFTFGIYFNAIVKTYALLSFFFTATLFVLTLKIEENRKFPLALAYAFAAVLVRVTSLFFVAPIFVYVLLTARRASTRLFILLTSAAATICAAFFLLPDWQAARWGLFDSHLQHWAGAGVSTEIYHILADRLPFIIQSYGPPLVLLGGSVYFMIRQRRLREWAKVHMPLLVVSSGLALFAASHFANGLWELEYLVPAMVAFLPIVAMVLGEVYQELGNESRIFVRGALAAVLFLLPLNESIQHVDITGRRLPIVEIDQVATLVSLNTSPADKVLVLESLGVALDANRSVLPGLELAQFSVQLMDNATAERFHVVNVAMLNDMVQKRLAPVVVLTDFDWGLLQLNNAEQADAMKRSLVEHYKLAQTITYFGPFANTVSVYVIR